MSTFNPIFDDDSLFGSKLKKTSCPSKSDICGNLPGTSVLDSFVIPKCNDINFKFSLSPEESPSGCCVVDTSNDTCGTYIPESATYAEEDYNIGIQFLDASGLNPRQICHSAPIRKRVIKLKDFFIMILMSALIILSTAIIGACYEFWLKYGSGEAADSSKLIFKYKYCANEISPIKYAFPSSLADSPYSPCADGDKLGFPYIVIKYFDIKRRDTTETAHVESVGKKVLKIFGLPVKAFCLNFLYTLVFSRKFISYVLEILSKAYNNIGDAPVVKNIIFLFLTGILFNVIAHITKIQSLNGGPGFVLYILSMIIMCATIFTLFLTNFILYWWPSDYDKYDSKGRANDDTARAPILNSNYGLIGNVFYALRNSPTSQETKKGAFNPLNLLKNIGLALLLFIPVSIAFTTGMLGSMLGLLYMILSLMFSIFYVPLSNTTCFLNLIKDHGDLLTLLFCVSIIVSSVNSFNSTTSGIISGLVGMIILYKIYKAMNK